MFAANTCTKRDGTKLQNEHGTFDHAADKKLRPLHKQGEPHFLEITIRSVMQYGFTFPVKSVLLP